MRKINRPNIGLLCVSLQLYKDTTPDFIKGREVFAQKIIYTLSTDVDITYSGVCCNSCEVNEAVKDFEVKGCHGILVVFLSYSASLTILPALQRTKLPIIIWNTQEDEGIPWDAPANITMDNHGVHGVQDLCSVLKRVGVPFKVYTGFWRNKEDIEKLIRYLRVLHGISELRSARIGLIGYPMQGMGDFNIDETALLSQIGTSIIHIPVDKLADWVERAPMDSVWKIMEEDKSSFDWDNSITQEEHMASAMMEWGIKAMVEEHNLNGWSQHFVALDSCSRIPTLPFLAASKLMAEGMAYAAEGDVCAAAMSIAMYALCGHFTFTEMFTMDFESNALLMSHMGELNISLARKGRPLRVVCNEFSLASKLPPPTPVFGLEPGDTTLVSLCPGEDGKFQLVIAEGEVIDFDPLKNINNPNFKWRPKGGDMRSFLDAFATYGGSHHQALGYGSWSEELELMAYFLGINAYRVD